MRIELFSNSTQDTQDIAIKIAKKLNVGDVVLLKGDLGAGKTTFVAGALSYFGYKNRVISPTFNILKCYFEVNPPIFHIDAYRLEDQNQEIGLEEFIEGRGITFIEWPQFISSLIPNKHLSIELYRIDDNKRSIIVSSDYECYSELISSLGE